MSELIVQITKIDEVNPHPNADRLDVCKIKGWLCVSQKGNFKAGDLCLYIPVDSVLGNEFEEFVFPPDSKIKPDKGRIKSIKIRGHISQGLLLPLSDIEGYAAKKNLHISLREGTDLANVLGITKYEPPASSVPKHMQGKSASKKNPHFKEYTDISNFKHYNRVFQPEEPVYITEKLHGTSARYGKVPTHIGRILTWTKKANIPIPEINLKNLKKRLLDMIGLLPKHEFVYGSRRVQLDLKLIYDGYYQDGAGNVYAKAAKQYDIEDALEPGEVLFGEIVGDGIQKNYTYGCRKGEIKFFAYDVMKDGQFLDPYDFIDFCRDRNIPHVPVLDASGEYIPSYGITKNNIHNPFSEELVDKVRGGDSNVGRQKVREGVVLKPLTERNAACGRLALKVINDDYYLAKDNTDFH